MNQPADLQSEHVCQPKNWGMSFIS